MSLFVSIFVLGIYFISPLIGKIALLIVNTILPDPIPYADEIIMWLGLLTKLSFLANLAIFIAKFKYLLMLVFVCLFLIILF